MFFFFFFFLFLFLFILFPLTLNNASITHSFSFLPPQGFIFRNFEISNFCEDDDDGNDNEMRYEWGSRFEMRYEIGGRDLYVYI